jgi:hypothetical protein
LPSELSWMIISASFSTNQQLGACKMQFYV